MGNAVTLILVVLFSFLLGLGFLVWMVRRYYWGPTGLPPNLRYGDKESAPQDSGTIDRKE